MVTTPVNKCGGNKGQHGGGTAMLNPSMSSFHLGTSQEQVCRRTRSMVPLNPSCCPNHETISNLPEAIQQWQSKDFFSSYDLLQVCPSGHQYKPDTCQLTCPQYWAATAVPLCQEGWLSPL